MCRYDVYVLVLACSGDEDSESIINDMEKYDVDVCLSPRTNLS